MTRASPPVNYAWQVGLPNRPGLLEFHSVLKCEQLTAGNPVLALRIAPHGAFLLCLCGRTAL
jgi:hypothetical protein